MSSKVTDEMLMAYVDGELDSATAEDVRLATERDASLAHRAQEFNATRQWVKDSFAGIKAVSPPDELLEKVLGGTASNIVPLRRHPALKTALPLAASIALAVGLAGYWLGQNDIPNGVDLFGGQSLAQAVGEIPAGQSRTIAIAGGVRQIESLATYKVDGGHCRSFSLRGIDRTSDVLGVGCNHSGDWRIEIAVVAGSNGTYSPASSGGIASLDAFLDAAGAREALTADEESELQGR